jgi:hypothetical protein
MWEFLFDSYFLKYYDEKIINDNIQAKNDDNNMTSKEITDK